MDAETWVGLDTKLRKAYHKPQDEAQSGVYFEALRLMPGPTIRLAIESLIKGEKFFPSIATIYEYCGDATRATSAPPSFDTVCELCHGEGWVDAEPIHALGEVYKNVVRRCPSCRPAVSR